MTRATTFCSALFLATSLSLSAYTVVFPTSAIEAAWELNADEFKEEFPGIDFTDPELTDEGWYVRYRHENLTYFFGPIESQGEAYQHEGKMHELRNDVVAKRPALGTSEVDVVFYSYDPRMGVPGGPGATATAPAAWSSTVPIKVILTAKVAPTIKATAPAT